MKTKPFGYIYYPSVSHSAISFTAIDEGLVNLFHFITNKKNEKKIVSLYALTARLPYGGSSAIGILRHITSEYNMFSIRQPLMKLKEMKQKIFGKPNVDQNLPSSIIAKQ